MTETVPLYTTPRARQEGGDHYLNMGIQPWDAMRFWLSPEQFTGYSWGTSSNTSLASTPVRTAKAACRIC